MSDTLAMAAWANFNGEERWRQGEVAKILRANFDDVVWDGTYDHVARQIVIALRTKAPLPAPPPPEFMFAEAFQSLTVKCLGYDDEIKALKRDIRALQG
ncbi:MAG TPA: hypothetical protein VFP43_09135 [Mesorhizobium sp.]|nr:hypothetical protein [Mesorhizobium sp.]